MFIFRLGTPLIRELSRKPGASLFSTRIRIRLEGLRIRGDGFSPLWSILKGDRCMDSGGADAKICVRTLPDVRDVVNSRIWGVSRAVITTRAGREEACMAFAASTMAVFWSL